jgi:hypothetical protein
MDSLNHAAILEIPSPGSIVKVRGREWVTLPQSRVEKQDQVLRLRPLGGGDQTIATLFWPLEGEQVKPASFALPDPALSGSQSSALLLRDALLLKLRAGAGPFRCLGNVALEPRPYQLVPLLMALKQEVSRVLTLLEPHPPRTTRRPGGSFWPGPQCRTGADAARRRLQPGG